MAIRNKKGLPGAEAKQRCFRAFFHQDEIVSV